jgi:hypothetical protein
MHQKEKGRTNKVVTGIAIGAGLIFGAMLAAAIAHGNNAPPPILADGRNGVYNFDD